MAIRNGSFELRDLERDRGDRARVDVVGLAQHLRGTGEEVVDAGERIGRGVEDRLEELEVHLPRAPDHCFAELFLAAGKVVVDRAEGGAGLSDDLLQPGPRVAVAPEELGGDIEDAIFRFGRHARRLVSG